MLANPTAFFLKVKEIDKLSTETISKVKSALQSIESLDDPVGETRNKSAAAASCLAWVCNNKLFFILTFPYAHFSFDFANFDQL